MLLLWGVQLSEPPISTRNFRDEGFSPRSSPRLSRCVQAWTSCLWSRSSHRSLMAPSLARLRRGVLCVVFCVSSASALVSSSAPATRNLSVDVLVYAANPAGIGAAIAAASNGSNTVALFEPLAMIGGMGAAGGVGLMNQGCGLEGVTGLGRVWGLLNGAYYSGPKNPPLNVFPDMFVAENSFWLMLNSTPGVTVWPGCRLVDVRRNGTCLTDADFLCADDTLAVSVAASAFIDASYDGDVMVAAGGIDFSHGREGQDEFNESLAGVSLLDEQNESFDRQNLSITATFPNGTFLPGISPEPLPSPGTADDSLMAFAYFACVSSDPGNMIPYPRPVDYDPDAFQLLQAQIDGVMSNGMYPNGPGEYAQGGRHAARASTKPSRPPRRPELLLRVPSIRHQQIHEAPPLLRCRSGELR